MPEVQAIKVRFQEAIDALASKRPEATLQSTDLAGPVHGTVFAVAGATSADLLSDLHQAVVRAKENGTTLADFRRDFDAAVARDGWAYRGSRGWRTAVIFNNNMRAAHMAGRWKQLQAGKARRPYLQYRTAGDARVRPEHRQWHGILRHIDDPFWLTHYPPCGWGCRCTVRAYSEAEVRALGLTVDREPFPVSYHDVTDEDGQVVDRVPDGIDPGWDHNVGVAWMAPELALGHKLARLPRELQGAVADRSISPAFQEVLADRWKAFRKAIKAAPKTPAAARTQVVGFLDGAVLQALDAHVPDLDLRSTAVAAVDDVELKAGIPSAWADALPVHLRDYSAVLWDRDAGELVVLAADGPGRKLTTVRLRPNQRTQYGQAITLQGLGRPSSSDLRDSSRYELLVGRLP